MGRAAAEWLTKGGKGTGVTPEALREACREHDLSFAGRIESDAGPDADGMAYEDDAGTMRLVCMPTWTPATGRTYAVAVELGAGW